jgi:hypothetical protein
VIRRALLWAGTSAVVLGLGARAARLAGRPPFEPGVPSTRAPQVEYRELRAARPTEHGVVTIAAERASTGHVAVGFFRLGPPTHLELVDTTLRHVVRGAAEWQIHGRSARWSGDVVRVFDGVRSLPDGTEARHGSIAVNLASGATVVD